MDEAYTVKGQMDQRERHHQEAMRAQALRIASDLLMSNNGEAQAIVMSATAAFGERRLELLANHLLTFIETGKFLEHGN